MTGRLSNRNAYSYRTTDYQDKPVGHHVSNTIPITGALPNDKAAIIAELDRAITSFPEKELKAYRDRIGHL